MVFVRAFSSTTHVVGTPYVAWPRRRPQLRGGAIRLLTDSSYHVPVLRDELVEWLVTDPSGTYCDGTFGGGGHSEALLRVLAPPRVPSQ